MPDTPRQSADAPTRPLRISILRGGTVGQNAGDGLAGEPVPGLRSAPLPSEAGREPPQAPAHELPGHPMLSPGGGHMISPGGSYTTRRLPASWQNPPPSGATPQPECDPRVFPPRTRYRFGGDEADPGSPPDFAPVRRQRMTTSAALGFWRSLKDTAGLADAYFAYSTLLLPIFGPGRQRASHETPPHTEQPGDPAEPTEP